MRTAPAIAVRHGRAVLHDRGGRLAAKGSVIEPVVRQLLRRAFFKQEPPKNAGREQFGREYVAGLLRMCGKADHHDVLATATALTARSTGMAVREFVVAADAANVVEGSRWPSRYREMVLSGGGVRNVTLMRMIRGIPGFALDQIWGLLPHTPLYLLAVPGTGAYCRSMASNYNHVPRPPVVGVRDRGSTVLVRRETQDDLLRLDAGMAAIAGTQS
jgi:hypothetical protein